MSSGVANCCMTPCAITPTRSDIESASLWSCVTNSVVMPRLALQALQLDLHLVAKLRVEVGERFVEQQHPWLRRERASDGDALLLAARELARKALAIGLRA